MNINLKDMAERKTCWICNSSLSIHVHHIIPQAFGGRDGPVCVLCASHHNLVHSFAKKLTLDRNGVIILSHEAYQDQDWRSLTDIARERLFYLSIVIFRSELVINGVANKTTAYAGVMSDAENCMLKEIVQVLNCSQHKAMMYGLQILHRKLINRKLKI